MKHITQWAPQKLLSWHWGPEYPVLHYMQFDAESQLKQFNIVQIWQVWSKTDRKYPFLHWVHALEEGQTSQFYEQLIQMPFIR